jgi:hypothetical protein
MAPWHHQQHAPRVIPTNNVYDTLADLSEDEISFPSDARHKIHPGPNKSRDEDTPTPFLFGPATSADRGYHLETVLSQLMVNSFTYMNGRIKGLAQQLQESEGCATHSWK